METDSVVAIFATTAADISPVEEAYVDTIKKLEKEAKQAAEKGPR